MSQVCTIITGSRLHFGPLAWKPASGRNFGGWGVMLETPRCVLRVGEIENERELAPDESASQIRADELLQKLRDRPGSSIPQSFRVQVLEEPPAHCGFGSGTQLALAVARGVAELTGHPNVPGSQLAIEVGRGLRSAVGVHGFDRGGLIVDAGKHAGDALGALAARVEFPVDWRFVLIRPAGTYGLMGDVESAAFRELPPFSQSLTDRLSRLLLTEILPAALAAEFDPFAAALTAYGMEVGEAFSHCQGGVVHRSSMPIWAFVRNCGMNGLAQTSWGPTLAWLCRSQDEASAHAGEIRAEFPQAHVTIARARNSGAETTKNFAD